jgi:hypothetical protein
MPITGESTSNLVFPQGFRLISQIIGKWPRAGRNKQVAMVGSLLTAALPRLKTIEGPGCVRTLPCFPWANKSRSFASPACCKQGGLRRTAKGSR